MTVSADEDERLIADALRWRWVRDVAQGRSVEINGHAAIELKLRSEFFTMWHGLGDGGLDNAVDATRKMTGPT